jgi:hypothetical protein
VKELFHIVIDRIAVTERTLEEIRASIRWKDGSPPTEIEMKLSPYVQCEIARLASAGCSNAAIAQHLNERAIKTDKNRAWNVNSVGLQLRRHRRRSASSMVQRSKDSVTVTPESNRRGN